jgi:hypothetical protein
MVGDGWPELGSVGPLQPTKHIFFFIQVSPSHISSATKQTLDVSLAHRKDDAFAGKHQAIICSRTAHR